MTVHVRQICLVASELEPVVELLSAVLGIDECHRDPAVANYGLENALLPIGTDFIEVVAPIKIGTAAGRYLDRRGGDGGYMVITQVKEESEQASIRCRAVELGVRIAHEEQRQGWSFCQLHPADMQVAFLDIEWDEQAEVQGCWHPAGGQDWQQKVNQDHSIEMTGVELQSDKPELAAIKWAQILDAKLERQNSSYLVSTANMPLRFIKANDGRGAGLGGIDLLVRDKDAVLARAEANNCLVDNDYISICGTRFYPAQ